MFCLPPYEQIKYDTNPQFYWIYLKKQSWQFGTELINKTSVLGESEKWGLCFGTEMRKDSKVLGQNWETRPCVLEKELRNENSVLGTELRIMPGVLGQNWEIRPVFWNRNEKRFLSFGTKLRNKASVLGQSWQG